MMGRLIDADDVISLLANHHFDDSKENTDLLIHNLCKEVKSVPTAYDPDKVVEQLENERKFWENAYDSNLGKEKARSYEHAIEIVKGGGVNGD